MNSVLTLLILVSLEGYEQAGFKGQYTTLMVVGGLTGSRRHDDTQLIDLTSGGTNSCTNWGNYPKVLKSATGSIISDKFIIHCGGDSGSRGFGYYDECYKMAIEAEEKIWTFLTRMNSKRSFVASIELDGKLFVAGGWNGTSGADSYSSTEFISVDGTVSPGPDLPSPRDEHCMIKLPSQKVLILGGVSSSVRKSAIEFNPATNSFKNLPSLTSQRLSSGCTVFNSPFHNGRPVALAAGGSGQATAEILDYTQPNSKWVQIANLPGSFNGASFNGARAVTSPSGQGAIVQFREDLYELTCETSNCSWTTLPQKLKKSVRHATLLALPAGTGCD